MNIALATQPRSQGRNQAQCRRDIEDGVQAVHEWVGNKEIASDLSLSEKTVKTHVSNILGKLNLPSRTQVALYAARIGLVVCHGDFDRLG